MSDTFPTTSWSLVLRAGEDDPDRAQAALSALCEAYWFPLYVYVRRRGVSEEDAGDLVQAYFLQLIDKRFLAGVRPEVGPFRAFLLHTMKRFISNERTRDDALRRGGGVRHLRLDMDLAESRFNAFESTHETPEQAFERNWARSIVDRIMARMASDAERSGRGAEFEKLQNFVLDGSERGDYSRVADRLKISTGAVKVAVHRLRKRFGQKLREEVANTVDDPQDIDSEVRYVLRLLS